MNHALPGDQVLEYAGETMWCRLPPGYGRPRCTGLACPGPLDLASRGPVRW